MNPRRRTQLDAVALACMLVVVALGAVPLLERGSRPQVIGVVVGAFGAGVALARLIRDARSQRRDERRTADRE